MLPEGVRLAYDGLNVPVTLRRASRSKSRVESKAPGEMAQAGAWGLQFFVRSMRFPQGLARRVAAVGNFDGVHLGHRAILAAAAAEARNTGARSVAITFASPAPREFLRPARAAADHAAAGAAGGCWAKTGIDRLLVLTFDAALARAVAARVRGTGFDRGARCARHA